MSPHRHRSSISQLRIIGGTLRRRKIRFAADKGLRPTSDRMRETLFNWLQHDVVDARCLDLYAGSGAFGFEAISRGARHVVMVEENATTFAGIKQAAAELGVGSDCDFYLQDDLHFIQQFASERQQPFDIIFLDPPYRHDLLQKVCALIHDAPCCHPGTWVYAEMEAQLTPSFVVDSWRLHRQVVTGGSRHVLWQVEEK